MRTMQRWSWLTVVAGILMVSATSLATAQDKSGAAPLDRKVLDQRVNELLREIINTGADLYNGVPQRRIGANPEACFHLYQGALLTLWPIIDHRPGLQKEIESALAEANRNPDPRQRAFALRNVIDHIRSEVNPGARNVASLWDRLGGDANVKKVVDDFVAAAASDPKVNFLRDGKFKDVDVANLKRLLVEQISAVSGGPYKYNGRGMKEVHQGMGITDAEFDAIVGDLKNALEKNGAQPQDVATVLKVIGGTRGDIVETKTTATLWDRLGGVANVRKVVDDFVAAAATDPKVNFFRDGKFKDLDVPNLKRLLVDLVSEVSGGPYKYSGRSMKDSHKGMGITNVEFDTLAGHLKNALEKNGAQPEDVNTVLKVIGGTRDDIVEKK
jgi:hemoglobin